MGHGELFPVPTPGVSIRNSYAGTARNNWEQARQPESRSELFPQQRACGNCPQLFPVDHLNQPNRGNRTCKFARSHRHGGMSLPRVRLRQRSRVNRTFVFASARHA
jgi:hypothetical protein